MQKIRIIGVGRLKESYWIEAQNEYLKRLTRYTTVEVVEIPAVGEDETALIKEGERVLKAVQGYYTIILAVEGKEYSSEGLASALSSVVDLGKPICFVIGGAAGLSQEVKKKADMLISLSALTLPHRLARIVLLEQLYRSFKIISGEPYHK